MELEWKKLAVKRPVGRAFRVKGDLSAEERELGWLEELGHGDMGEETELEHE